jgi:hypothetical protein
MKQVLVVLKWKYLTDPNRNACGLLGGIARRLVNASSGIDLDLLAKGTVRDIEDPARHSTPTSGVQTLSGHGIASRGWAAEVYARVGSEAEQSS